MNLQEAARQETTTTGGVIQDYTFALCYKAAGLGTSLLDAGNKAARVGAVCHSVHTRPGHLIQDHEIELDPNLKIGLHLPFDVRKVTLQVRKDCQEIHFKAYPNGEVKVSKEIEDWADDFDGACLDYLASLADDNLVAGWKSFHRNDKPAG